VTRPRHDTPRLDIHLFGPPLVLVDGAPLAVDTRKAVAILALLAAEGRPFARDELAALLWPESDDTAARGALRRTLSTMRTALGDGPLIIDRSRVDLDRRLVRVDLEIVEAATQSDDRGTLSAAAALVKGAFLTGFNLRDSPDFDDWRAARAVAAERAILTVLDRLAAVAEADGDLPAAIAAASRRLDLDPLDEGGHVRLMDLLMAADDRSAALRQYRVCVATLDRELGVEPLASTTARYEAIRDADPGAPTARVRSTTTASRPATADAPPASAATALPAVPSFPFVGRAASLDTILSAHASAAGGTGRLIELVGEAGIGKTRLGEETAGRVRATGGVVLAATAYPAERAIAYGPVVEWLRAALLLPDADERFARLSDATRAELARLLPAIEPRGAAAPPDGPGAHARLVAAIADGLTSLVAGPTPGILWIDDVPWLDASTREALEFLARRLAGRPIVLLLTWRSGDLDADGGAFVDRLAATSGAERIELGRLERADVALLVGSAAGGGSTDPAVVDRLAAASEGLPLYVVEALTAGHGSSSETLPAGVSWVLRERLTAVSETAGQVLSAASVIGRSFDSATLRHASGRTDDETVDALDEAVRRGLIREAPAGFDFVHGALRDLAYEGTSLARRRLLHRRVAEALRLDLAGSGRDDLARLVLIAGHERAAGRDVDAAEAYRQAGDRAAGVFANLDAIAHDEAALALGHPDAAGLYSAIGRLRTRIGDYAGAIAALETAAALGDDADLPGLEWALSRAHLRRGDLAAASHHLDAAAAAAPDDPGLAARLWVDRSVIRRRLDDPAGAALAARFALTAAEAAHDPIAAGAAHRMLGLAAVDAGQPGAAIADLEIALAAAADDPDPTAQVAALTGLAMATARTDDLDAAMLHGEAAAAACRRIGDRHLEAAVENHLADLLHGAGRDDDAMPHLHRAVEAFAEVGGDPADPDPGIWMLSAS
jgi:DNA-binding SARP family transcriptional activator/tetratricopeptide (TPR) repeat protein